MKHQAPPEGPVGAETKNPASPPEPEAAASRHPSFAGRLRLADYAFASEGAGAVRAAATAAAAAPTSPCSAPLPGRRSPRLRGACAGRDGTAPSNPGEKKKKGEKRKRASGEPWPRPQDEEEDEDEDEDAESVGGSAQPAAKSRKKNKEKQATTSPHFPAPPPTKTTAATTTSREPAAAAAEASSPPLPPLPDALAPGLLVLFIGLNPGVLTSRTGHAYAHPTNLFWRLLRSSGITPGLARPCRPEEDRTLPARFGLGHTNIAARPTRSGAGLRRAELDAGVPVLEAKCRRWRPQAVCLTGKGIWESVFRVRYGRNLGSGGGGGGGGGSSNGAPFAYGWQPGERMGVVRDGDPEAEPGGNELGARGPWPGAHVFVASSTSGLAATLRPEEKERIWKELGDWCAERRRERAAAAEAGAPNPTGA